MLIRRRPILLLEKPGSFDSDWLRPITEEYFEIRYWEPGQTYANDTVLCVSCNELGTLYEQWRQQGRRIIIDNLSEMIDTWWDHYPPDADRSAMILQNPNWFWYQESMHYHHLGLHDYRPNPTAEYLALMPMRLRKTHRDDTIKALYPYMYNFIWSYVENGKQLPNDRDISLWETQRYFNPEWYDRSCISVVSESWVVLPRDRQPFVTEKTFKPMAFRHPYIVIGHPGTLQYLHTQGFVSFDNLWDESYDLIDNFADRLEAIRKIISELLCFLPDSETQDRLEYNHLHFFDQDLIQTRLRRELLRPMLNYALS